jgi:hypothetical protein
MNIINIVFPKGNKWFYYLSIPWVLAVAIFLISLPALLTSTGYWYEHEMDTTVDFGNDLIDLSANLLDMAFALWRFFCVFVAISCFVDIYYLYKEKMQKDGWL